MSELVEDFPCLQFTYYVDSDHDSAPARGGVAAHDHLLLVGNPTSRGGKAAERIEQASALMDELGMSYEYRATLPDGGTVGMVSDAITDEGLRTVVYLGGDGSFNKVARASARTGSPARCGSACCHRARPPPGASSRRGLAKRARGLT
jgi:hypothetical protein